MKKIGKDKWKHFFVGLLLGIIFQSVLFFILSFSPLSSIIITIVMVAAIAYGFELFSLYSGYGHYDKMDAVASLIGGVVGQVLLLPAIL